MLEQHRQTLGQAIHSALQRELIRQNKMAPNLSKKESFRVVAPPNRWGNWVPVFAQIGVVGPNPDRHQTKIRITFVTTGELLSSYDVQIKGGDRAINTVGDSSTNSELITITGNVATSISIRCRSHSFLQNILVNVF